MTVWIDDMYLYPMGQFGRMKMSHMISDNEDELHAMAQKVGVAKKWYQKDHYDICMEKRLQAIAFGAVPITLKQLSCMAMLRRMGQPMGVPEAARLALGKAIKRASARRKAVEYDRAHPPQKTLS
jgi:hypothetical protein